jgi:peptide/nickel transport system substrate-binding protein
MSVSRSRRAHAALALALVALGLAGCGSGGGGSGPDQTAVPAEESPTFQSLVLGNQGGTLTVLNQSDFQHLDPGQAYTSVDLQVVSATQRTLYSFLPNNTQAPVPDLAAGQPQVSRNGLAVTVHLKHGVDFSPPVNREVTAADVVYAFDRALNPHVATPYFRTYFGDLVGARRAHGGRFAGVTATNRYTVVFRLTRPTAPTLISALVLPISAPVPPELARPLDARKRTSYGTEFLAATGPYMVESGAGGRILGVGYHPGHSALLVRNPNWRAATDFRPAYLDRVVIRVGGDPTAIGHEVLIGSDMVQNDTPASSIVALAFKSFTPQMAITRDAALSYVGLDNRHGPFSNISLRRALWAALDRESMVDATGGAITGLAGTHFILPGLDGYEEGGGQNGPQVDYNRSLSPSLSVSRRYLEAAGFPDGRYTGPAVTLVGATGDPDGAYAAIVDRALIALGFRVHVRLVSQAAMLRSYCAVPARQIEVCPGVTRGPDFAGPEALLRPAFYGASITRLNSPNVGQVSVPTINAAMDAALLIRDPATKAATWGRIDQELVDNAVAIPFQFLNQPALESCDVAGVTAQWNAGWWDYAFTSLQTRASSPACLPPAP